MTNKKLLTALALLSMVFMVGCGEDTPVAPAPVPSVAPPAQTFLRLSVTAYQDGRIVERVSRNTFFSVEAANVCLNSELPCPRPSKVQWNITGAFCEPLGDVSGPGVFVLCTGIGIASLNAYAPEFNVSGSGFVQVVP